MFDITVFKPVDTAALHLKSPANEQPIMSDGQPVGITFYAPGSEAYEKATAARTNKALIRSKKKVDLTAEALLADQLDFLAEVTISFDNLTFPGADKLKGPDLFRALYVDRKFAWITDQATAFLGDWENFIEKSATS